MSMGGLKLSLHRRYSISKIFMKWAFTKGTFAKGALDGMDQASLLLPHSASLEKDCGNGGNALA